MYQLTKSVTFDAAHLLRNYVGKCANLHGHTYKLEVAVAGEKVDEVGMLYDFFDLKKLMQGVVDQLDHRFINEIPPYNEINPTAENMAYQIYQTLRQQLAEQNQNIKLKYVQIWETPTASATYSED
ncbi:MAG: queuosine biosynthesis protein QueD [Chloroflexi bacterium]|jgi:6-pyruvoyltetrahydropterin/6-carboxytetrahydropterin synthase|nr:queuosine biosynthesis protein QueD [Chloroflexota bacterium]